MPSWIPALNERPLLPPIVRVVPAFLQILLLVIPHRSGQPLVTALRGGLLYPLLLASALIPPVFYTTGNKGDDYGAGSNGIYILLTVIDRFFLSSVPADFVPPSGVAPSGYGPKRWIYAIKLANNMRGAGWSFEVRNTPKLPNPNMSRVQYLIRQIPRLLINYIIIDFNSTYQHKQPYFNRQVPLSSVTVMTRLLYLYSAAMMSMGALSFLYDVCNLFCVASGIWEPKECVPLLGPLAKANSVRGFWGHTWHQSFRRLFTHPATYFFPNSRLAMLVIPFFLSGVTHGAAMFSMHRTGLETFWFFMIQPIGMLLDSVFARNNTNWGFLWVLVWFGATLHLFFDEMVQGGMWEIDLVPFSIVKGVQTGQFWYR